MYFIWLFKNFPLYLYCSDDDNNKTSNIMINQFDFFTVQLNSKSIRALLQFPGVNRSSIRSRVDRSGRFPRNIHEVTLKYFSVNDYGSHGKTREVVEQFLQTLPSSSDVMVSAKFYPVD